VFRIQVKEALADPRPTTPHDQVMREARALIRPAVLEVSETDNA